MFTLLFISTLYLFGLGSGDEIVSDSVIPSIGSELEYRNNVKAKTMNRNPEDRVGARVSSEALGPTQVHQRSKVPNDLPRRVIHVRPGMAKIK